MEFPDKKLFTGKPESLCYSINRRDLFSNGSSVAKRSIQLSYRRNLIINLLNTFFYVIYQIRNYLI